MTRQQIGQALEYQNPQKAIDNIHAKHRDRLNKFSATLKVRATDGKMYETTLYSAKGIYEICRWSRQPKADEFYDHVYGILEGLRLGYLKLTAEKSTQTWEETRKAGKLTRQAETDTIKRLVEYAKEQGSMHSDKLYMTYSKLANKMAGIANREEASIMQLNNLSLMEHVILHMVDAGILAGKHYKEIYQDCKCRLMTIKDLAYLG